LSTSINGTICAGGWLMSPTSSDASMLAVAGLAPLRPTLLAVDSCNREHANLLVPGQIVSGLVHSASSPRPCLDLSRPRHLKAGGGDPIIIYNKPKTLTLHHFPLPALPYPSPSSPSLPPPPPPPGSRLAGGRPSHPVASGPRWRSLPSRR
jgi:hypothetical protein